MPKNDLAAADAAPAAAPAVPTTDYQLLGHLEIDGKSFAPQRDKVVTVALTKDQADPLLAAGVIGPAPVAANPNS